MSLKGEAYKKTFTVIRNGIPSSSTLGDGYDENLERTQRCCFKLPVLAAEESTEDLQNDKTSFYFGYTDIVTSVSLDLMYAESDTVAMNLDTSLINVKEAFSYGFHENGGKKYVGAIVHWRPLVIDYTLRVGYYCRATCTTIFGTTFTETSFTYCLDRYTPASANHTVRLDFYHSGITGNRDNDEDLISYKDLEWFGQIRIPKAIILNETAESEVEEIQYTNGQMVDAKNDQTTLWNLEIASLPNWLHRYLRIDVLTADVIYATDYNVNNPLKPFVYKKVKARGNYAPNWIETANQSSVNIQLTPRYNNLRKRWS